MTTMLTEKEVAERLQVTPRTVRRWRTEGCGPAACYIGSEESTIRYHPDDLEAFIASKRRPLPKSAESAMRRAAEAFDAILGWKKLPEKTAAALTSLRDELRAHTGGKEA